MAGSWHASPSNTYRRVAQTMDMACYPKRCILACCPQDIFGCVVLKMHVYRSVAPYDVCMWPHVTYLGVFPPSHVYERDIFGVLLMPSRCIWACCLCYVCGWVAPYDVFGCTSYGATQLHHIGNKPIYILRAWATHQNMMYMGVLSKVMCNHAKYNYGHVNAM